MECSVEGCENDSRARGMCPAHYRSFMNYGRTHLIKQKNTGKCSVDGCEETSRRGGMCPNHYALKRKYGVPEKLIRNKRSHPLYIMWFDRKTNNCLCDDWLDFDIFVQDVGERPGENYRLVRTTIDPYGPENTKWVEHLKKEEGESNRAWYARKWASRTAAYPTMDRERHYFSKYNITIADYDEMFAQQEGLCEICLCAEKAIDVRQGLKKNLAVDHCHATGKVRGLLCWRCNVILGKVDDSPALLHSMIAYLKKYNGAE